MASYSTNEFKSGLKVLVNNEPWVILQNEFHKPGKGQAVMRIKLKNLFSGRVIERTLKSGESLEGADVDELKVVFLYKADQIYFFMNQEDFTQYEVSEEIVGDGAKWLKEQAECDLLLWNEKPMQVQAPQFMDLKVIETDQGVKGDTVCGGTKPATLETGAVVRVPLFIQVDEIIRVDTIKGEYISRAK